MGQTEWTPASYKNTDNKRFHTIVLPKTHLTDYEGASELAYHTLNGLACRDGRWTDNTKVENLFQISHNLFCPPTGKVGATGSVCQTGCWIRKGSYLSIYWCLKNKLYANILLLIYGYLHEKREKWYVTDIPYNKLGNGKHILIWQRNLENVVKFIKPILDSKNNCRIICNMKTKRVRYGGTIFTK